MTKRHKNGTCIECGLTINGMTAKEEKELQKEIEEAKNEPTVHVHLGSEARCKGLKTDAELYDEYLAWEKDRFSIGYLSYTLDYRRKKMTEIAEELGPEKILQERLRRLEERVQELEGPVTPRGWIIVAGYSVLLFVTGILVSQVLS